MDCCEGFHFFEFAEDEAGHVAFERVELIADLFVQFFVHSHDQFVQEPTQVDLAEQLLGEVLPVITGLLNCI